MAAPKSEPLASLHRRNSISTTVVVPSKLTLPRHSSSFPTANGGATIAAPPSPLVDFELVSLKDQSYTSLKDLLPSSACVINSPTAAGNSGYEISIRNHLVKQAAWAYLQPMATSPYASGPHFLRRMWLKFADSSNPITACFRFINRHIFTGITRAFDRILNVVRIRMNR